MHKRDYPQIRFLTGIGAILFFFSLYVTIITLSPFLKTSSLFHKDLIGSYLSFFIPINVISWLTLGQAGGIIIFFFSCLLIAFIVLRNGVFYYNVYVLLFGIAACVGYRIFQKIMFVRNKSLSRRETLDIEKNTFLSKIKQMEKNIEISQGRVERYAALKDMIENLSLALDLEKVAGMIVEETFNIIGRSDRALLFLIDELKQELALVASKILTEPAPIKTKKGEIFDTWILKQRKPLIVEDLDNDFRFSPEALRDAADRDFKSIISVPLMSGNRIVGVLRMDSKKREVYNQDDLRLLGIISNLAAVSVGNCMLYQRVNELAIKDGLTGLYVHRYFKERLDTELKRMLAKDRKFSILMIDLDYFKDCNDRYGHTAGDILLVKIAEVLREAAGKGNIVSRYGGEEFAIFLFESDKKEAVRIAEDIRRKIGEHVFVLRRYQVKITVSVGVSSFPEDGYLPEGLLKKADGNLYKAKQGGRNRVCPNLI